VRPAWFAAAALLALSSAPVRAQPAYDARLRQSFAAAQALQGPLDGGWTVTDRRGRGLVRLQLVDKGRGEVEGAWRDLRDGQASGLIDASRVSDGRVSFVLDSGASLRLDLRRGSDGRWTGRLRRGEAVSDVVLARVDP
jgi:hypothetical protein